MRREKRWRYYCEFCKKSGASGGHMSRHEKSCTLNPNRMCRMCEVADEAQPNMSDMIEALSVATVFEKGETIEDFDNFISYTIENEKEAVDKLCDVANGCPACMLAALRQHGTPFLFESFNFKEAKDEFWADKTKEMHGQSMDIRWRCETR